MPLFFEDDWCGLHSSTWVPLNPASGGFTYLPNEPGLYRVRPVTHEQLTYIGQTGRNLRIRLRELASGVYKPTMPYNDPHTAAPGHWAYRVADNMDFECSAAVANLADSERHGLEDYLLWQFRCEAGKSTLLNYGRFHPYYSRSTNRAKGRIGTLLPKDMKSLVATQSTVPLPAIGVPADVSWMGLEWSPLLPLAQANKTTVPEVPSVYKFIDDVTSQLLYIGESYSLAARLLTHRRSIWAPHNPHFSFHALSDVTIPSQRHEIESDLLGSLYKQTQRAPIFQYGQNQVRQYCTHDFD